MKTYHILFQLKHIPPLWKKNLNIFHCLMLLYIKLNHWLRLFHLQTHTNYWTIGHTYHRGCTNLNWNCSIIHPSFYQDAWMHACTHRYLIAQLNQVYRIYIYCGWVAIKRSFKWWLAYEIDILKSLCVFGFNLKAHSTVMKNIKSHYLYIKCHYLMYWSFCISRSIWG